MTPAGVLAIWLLALVCLHGAAGVAAYGQWLAPQNHRVVRNGSCVAAGLDATDFCARVVTYPVPSSLLRTRATEGILAPAEADRVDLHPDAHADESTLQRNDLGAVLSSRAEAEYAMLLAHHDQAALIAANLPGGVRHAARSRAVASGATEEEAEAAALATPIPGQEACETLLRRYSCQNQYSRCVDTEQYLDASGRPLELHTCYALCHAVRTTCHLTHRLDCRTHHRALDPLFEAPSEHALRFDRAYADGQDPYAAFWHIDCIDSPPDPWKHMGAFLLHGGPARWLAYAAVAVIVYALVTLVSAMTNEDETATRMRVRRERRQARAKEESQMQRARNKYTKLQQLRTQLIEAQQADTVSSSSPFSPMHSPGARTGSREPGATMVAGTAGSTAARAELERVDRALAVLERELNTLVHGAQQRRAKEEAEDVTAGYASAPSAAAASSDPRARSLALRRYLEQGGSGPDGDGRTFAEAEGFLDSEAEGEGHGAESEDDEMSERRAEGADGSFGHRQRRPVFGSPFSPSSPPPQQQQRPLTSSHSSPSNTANDEADEFEDEELMSPANANAARRR